eukprot:scaffold117735_cov81-Phaeocystis_antarctica.AAC.2
MLALAVARRERRQSQRASTKHNALVEFRTRKRTDTGNKHHGCTPQPTRWHTQVVPITGA